MIDLNLLDYYKIVEQELAGFFSNSEIKSLQRIIIEKKLKIPYHQIFLNPSEKVSPADTFTLKKIITQLKTGKPIQYILGETEFYGLTIALNRDVLIPRPETEELVDLLLKSGLGNQSRILDIGTGSGCIAIALAKNLPESNVTAIDISKTALRVAKENAIFHQVNIEFRLGNILDPKDKISDIPFDLIVSNPPYVRKSEANLMRSNVINFEPHIALFVGDEDPLLYYRAIASRAGDLLRRNGRIALEINEAFGAELCQLFNNFNFVDTNVLKDINGKDRFLMAMHE